ncbi:MAG: STAS domain-containing protein [Burkholderiaceae bacterium]
MLVLPQELTQSQATACLRMLLQGLRSQSEELLELDAAALQQFDSSALAVLLEFHRECLAFRKKLVIKNLSPRLLDLAVLYGIEGLLPRS